MLKFISTNHAIQYLTDYIQKRIVITANESELNQNYLGEHKAPQPPYASPICNVTLNGSYPNDIYEGKGKHYAYEPVDYEGLNIILEAHNKPNYRVKIYRAVPKIESPQELINKYEAEKKYIMKNGKPTGKIKINEKDRKEIEKELITIYGESDENSLVLTYVEKEIEKLKNSNIEDFKKIKIEKGNWVSPSKQYAKQHGMAALNNKYRILQKTVKAKDLYTDGNSYSEWGYFPS